MAFTAHRAALAALFALALAPQAVAEDYRLGDLVIEAPTAYETPPMAMAGGGYMRIVNTGETADRLIEVRADYPRVEIHTTEMEDGVARMVHLEDGLAIAPGETVTLERGGNHVMFMGIGDAPFVAGETVEATLVFEAAGEIGIVFEVIPQRGHDAGHGGHDN